MRINHYLLCALIWAATPILSCSSDDGTPENEEEFPNALTTDVSTLSFSETGGVLELKISTEAPEWALDAGDVTWLTFSQTEGETGNASITVTAPENPAATPRTATVTITAPGAKEIKVSVSQLSPTYPSYNTLPLAPDATGMAKTAVQIAAEMGLGWNIGNTLEAIGGETAWGNPLVTQELIDLVKAHGFNSIRIPCSWNQHMENSATAKLKTQWLNRVKQVIEYCVNNDMYVVLNIHWDGGWLENNCTVDKQRENNAKQKAFWEQIATHLRDFDEHVLFASANEPNVENSTQMTVLKSYHQTFIDAVRSTGGKNTYRVLVVQGPSTDIEKTKNLMSSLPTDPTPDRLMAEIHYYTPYNFCLMTEDASWGKMFYYWGNGYHSATETDRNPTYGEEADVDANFLAMKTKFVNHGIPVILGEYAAMRRTNLATPEAVTKHLESRAYYLKYVTKKALENGLIPFYWDAGSLDNFGSGLFNRNNNTVFDQQALDAILEGAQ